MGGQERPVGEATRGKVEGLPGQRVKEQSQDGGGVPTWPSPSGGPQPGQRSLTQRAGRCSSGAQGTCAPFCVSCVCSWQHSVASRLTPWSAQPHSGQGQLALPPNLTSDLWADGIPSFTNCSNPPGVGQ